VAKSPEDLRALRRFLLKAAFDDDFRGAIPLTPFEADGDGTITDVDVAFRDVRDAVGEDHPRWVPPKSLCRELAAWTSWLDEYSGFVSSSPPHDQMYVVVRYAMPLHPTSEEGGAAG
jgi:hypothetical protein